jgi:sulfate adenylyltransferase
VLPDAAASGLDGPGSAVVGPSRRAELMRDALRWPSWRLTRRQLCDLEMLACGGFAPLDTFLGREDHDSVCESMRLSNGSLWPMPVTLDVSNETMSAVEASGSLALRDAEGVMVAAIHVTQAWQPDLSAEASAVFATTDERHPGVEYLLRRTNPWYVTGRLEVLQPFSHHDFPDLRHTPTVLRAEFAKRGWTRVVAFNTRNPMHRAHLELTLRGAEQAEAHLLIHPVVGETQPGDVDRYTRIRCYQALMPSYPAGLAMLSLLPLAMRMGGPREALWHAVIRKNYGVTHVIVGRDPAGPRAIPGRAAFYRPTEAKELLEQHEDEVGVKVISFSQMVYVPETGSYEHEDSVATGTTRQQISGTELRRRLAVGDDLPEWFTPRAVAPELRRRFPPRSERGFGIVLTGLSGAGKSTVANMLLHAVRESDARGVTLLDGEDLRSRLSSELGFSAEDRERHMLRVGYVASEIAGVGGLVICALIAPYDKARRELRAMLDASGGYVLVHVATPLAVCEARDRKGIYAKARAGLLSDVTGVSSLYEEPKDADVVVDLSVDTPAEATDRVLAYLVSQGYLGAPAGSPTPVVPAA